MGYVAGKNVHLDTGNEVEVNGVKQRDVKLFEAGSEIPDDIVAKLDEAGVMKGHLLNAYLVPADEYDAWAESDDEAKKASSLKFSEQYGEVASDEQASEGDGEVVVAE